MTEPRITMGTAKPARYARNEPASHAKRSPQAEVPVADMAGPAMHAPAVACVNGSVREVPGDSARLIDWLRMTVGLTSAKEACGEGYCGACTVLIDGVPTLSCCTLAALAAGTEILTAEALADYPLGERLAAGLIERGAIQCGFCTPGVFVTAFALLTQNRALLGKEIREGLVGNLCRCTGYEQLITVIAELSRDDAVR